MINKLYTDLYSLAQYNRSMTYSQTSLFVSNCYTIVCYTIVCYTIPGYIDSILFYFKGLLISFQIN